MVEGKWSAIGAVVRTFEAASISALVLAGILPASAQAYSYMNIVTAGPGQGLSLYPAVNSYGVVAYVISPRIGQVLVQTADGGAPTTIADLRGDLFSISSVSPPSINVAGTVAFSTVTPDGNGQIIYAGDGGPLVSIADTSGIIQTFFGIPSINTAGAVAFGAFRRDNTEALYAASGGTLTPIAETGSMFSSFHNNGGPSLNDTGDVAFNADRGGGCGLAIFISSQGVISLVAGSTDDGSFTVIEGRPAIPSFGAVAFLAFFRADDVSGAGVFVGDSSGAPPTLVAIANVSGTPAMNGAGIAAYIDVVEGGNEVIYTKTGPDDPAVEVIRTGTPLFGSTATLLGLSTYGFNESGQLTFGAQLADGRSVIVRADPGDSEP